ncbi:MAG TPA: glycosyltransferase family 4 protein [Chthoniobacterales bacterium]|nr:glycosyltransferase family 4 protein [Chthoniobacterales bacterium]
MAEKHLCIVDPVFTLESPTMKHLVYAVPALIAAGWHISVIAEEIEPNLPVEAWPLEQPRIRMPILAGIGSFSGVQKSVHNFRASYPEAIIFGTPAMPYNADVTAVHFLQHVWLREARKVRGMDLREHTWLLLAKVLARRAAKDFSLNRQTIWLPVSESIAAELRKIVACPERVCVLPNSYDESRFNLKAASRLRGHKRTELNFGGNDFVFAFLSQGHHRRKGFWIAVEAIATLRNQRPAHNPRFLVIGGAPSTLNRLKQKLSQRIHDWRDWIHFTGMSQRPEEYLAAADAFLFPSYFEAFCLAEIEAAATGLPLLLTPHYGVEMILEHGRNGLTIDWQPSVLSNQLLDFLTGASALGTINPFTLRPRNFEPSVGRALNRSDYGSALLGFLEMAYQDKNSAVEHR